MQALWPFGLYILAVLGLAAMMLLASWLLGERHTGERRAEPYESGVPPTGTARARFSANFYLVAMFFVIFDLEVAFIFAWAVAAGELGWPGYVEVCIFIGVLLAGLAFVWRMGGLSPGASDQGPGASGASDG